MAETRIEYMPLSALTPADRNPKFHDLAQLKASIDRFGFTNPALLDERTGKLLAGHGRVEALKGLKQAGAGAPERIRIQPAGGEWLVPVVRGISTADDREAEAYLVADNRLVEIGGWDEGALSAILEDLRKAGTSLDGIGWDPAELDRLSAVQEQAVVRGPTVDEYAASFEAGAIKQIQLYFTGAEFDAVLARLYALMESNKLESHTAAFKFLLEQYEARLGNRSAG